MRLRATRLSLESWPRRLGLPLDFLPFAAAAYSFRLLRSNYTGGAMIGRRSTDNDQTVIGFDANGRLDTARLLDFAGAGSVFVTTWYDQSLFARHATQTSPGSQPRIVNAGVLETLNGRPVLYQSFGMSLNVPMSVGATSTVNYAARFISGSGINGRVLSGYPNWVMGWWSGLHTRYWQGSYWIVEEGNGGPKTAIHTAITNVTVQLVARDGVPLSFSAGVAANTATGLSTNGGWSGGSEASENLFAELTVFDVALPTADRQALERNQGAYYGIAVA